MISDRSGRRGPAWSAQEDAIVRAGRAAGKTLAQIAEDVRAGGHVRTSGAVAARVRALEAPPKVVAPAPISTWAPAHEEIVRQGYERGDSGGQIAWALCDAGRAGTSRSAVIGKIARMVAAGIMPHRSGVGAPDHHAAKRARQAEVRADLSEARAGGAARKAPPAPPQPARPIMPAARPVAADAPEKPAPAEKPAPKAARAGVPLSEVEGVACRWPVGEGVGLALRVCGCAPVSGRPYCAEHMARAYEPGSARPMRVPRDGLRVRPHDREREDRTADMVDAIGGGA